MLQLSYVVTVPAVTAVTAATFYPKLSKLTAAEMKTILSLCFRVMSCGNMMGVMVVVVTMMSVVVAQATKENGDMNFENMGTEEGFMMTKEFKVSYRETKRESQNSFHQF